jgi:Class II flagellar assembly regulator
MKVIPGAAPPATTAPRRLQRRGESGGTSFILPSDDTPAGSPALQARPSSPSQSLYAAQEVGQRDTADQSQERRGQTKRGHAILNLLDEMRLALLGGGIARDRLLQIRALLSAPMADTRDARLQEVIAEIELRAEVELAKYEP